MIGVFIPEAKIPVGEAGKASIGHGHTVSPCRTCRHFGSLPASNCMDREDCPLRIPTKFPDTIRTYNRKRPHNRPRKKRGNNGKKKT